MTIGSFFRSAYPGPGLVVLKKSLPSIWGGRKVPRYPEGNFLFFVGDWWAILPLRFVITMSFLCISSGAALFMLSIYTGALVEQSCSRISFFHHVVPRFEKNCIRGWLNACGYIKSSQATKLAGKSPKRNEYLLQQIYLAYPFLRLKRTFSMNSAEYSAHCRGNLKWGV